MQKTVTPQKKARMEIADIPLAKLVRHDANRRCCSVNLVESIKTHGQVSALRVRPVAGGKYQIIAGERRVKALRLAGKRVARCEIVRLSDRDALIQLAIDNSQRENINPIERAELILKLMLPESEGGAGMGSIEAGKLFGLESSGGCKNAIRLLKLPQFIKDVVASGELPEREARSLLSLVGTETMDKIERRLSHNKAKAISQIKRGLYRPKDSKKQSGESGLDAYSRGIIDASNVAKELGATRVAERILGLIKSRK